MLICIPLQCIHHFCQTVHNRQLINGQEFCDAEETKLNILQHVKQPLKITNISFFHLFSFNQPDFQFAEKYNSQTKNSYFLSFSLKSGYPQPTKTPVYSRNAYKTGSGWFCFGLDPNVGV